MSAPSYHQKRRISESRTPLPSPSGSRLGIVDVGTQNLPEEHIALCQLQREGRATGHPRVRIELQHDREYGIGVVFERENLIQECPFGGDFAPGLRTAGWSPRHSQ